MTTPLAEAPFPAAPPAADLAEAIRQTLAASAEPLTPAKIKARLPAPFRTASAEELADCLNRQVAVQVFYLYPKYRSPHDRYWDRPMRVHVASLLGELLAEGPRPLAAIRRKLPVYAAPLADEALHEQLRAGALHRHPPLGKRGREQFATAPPDPKTYLRPELSTLFRTLEQIGFARAQVRAAALELLHEEEWAEPAEPAAEEKSWTAHPQAAAPSAYPSAAPHAASAAPLFSEHP